MDRESIVDAIWDWLGENCSCITIKTCEECARDSLVIYEKQIRTDKRIDINKSIAASLSILHWDNGCSKCPLIEECKKNDEEDKQCQDVWYNWLENIDDE